jgi:hypothetical protein
MRKSLATSSEMGERMKCSNCNHENSDETKFCESCGENLQAKCSECGAFNSAKNKFCEKCGHKFATSDKPKATAPAPTPITTKAPFERKIAKPEIAPSAPLKPAQPVAQVSKPPVEPEKDTLTELEQSGAQYAARFLQSTLAENMISEQPQKIESSDLYKNSDASPVQIKDTKDIVAGRFTRAINSSISDTSLFVKPQIPQKKFDGASSSYATGVSISDVLVLIDITVWGGAKEGMIVTSESIYFKELAHPPVCLPHSDIKSIAFEPGKLAPSLRINDTLVFPLGGVSKANADVFSKLLFTFSKELSSL